MYKIHLALSMFQKMLDSFHEAHAVSYARTCNVVRWMAVVERSSSIPGSCLTETWPQPDRSLTAAWPTSFLPANDRQRNETLAPKYCCRVRLRLVQDFLGLKHGLKVFLRHGYGYGYGYGGGLFYIQGFVLQSMTAILPCIAPERAREDQNLTTVPHFSAGHAQWRYALATWGVCI